MLGTPEEGESDLPPTWKFNVHENLESPDTVMLASFPRSGNTMTRSLLAKIMGVKTGDYHNLFKPGPDKEKIGSDDRCPKRVHVQKTHYPIEKKPCDF